MLEVCRLRKEAKVLIALARQISLQTDRDELLEMAEHMRRQANTLSLRTERSQEFLRMAASPRGHRDSGA